MLRAAYVVAYSRTHETQALKDAQVTCAVEDSPQHVAQLSLFDCQEHQALHAKPA
jgi:hypothetical protein